MRATIFPGIGLAVMFAAVPTAGAADAPLQELTKVSALEGVAAAYWTGSADGYALSVTLDNARFREKQRARAAANAASNAPQTPRPTPQPTPQPYFPSPAQPDRAAQFIANTIENLRGLDPTFSCRTLTLADGRRQGRITQPPPPPIQRDARVQVWLLKADGTHALPASYDCRKDGDLVHITYAFDAAEVGAAAAAAVRVGGDYVIEALQPSAGRTAAP